MSDPFTTALAIIAGAALPLALAATAPHQNHHHRDPAASPVAAPSASPVAAPSASPVAAPSASPIAMSNSNPLLEQATTSDATDVAPMTEGQPSAAAPGYLAWVSIDKTPTKEQIRAAAGKYQTVILGAFMRESAEELRALDPRVRILAYTDLASVREYDRNQAISSGVSYDQAVDRGWLARDTSGQPITWNGYPGHFQTAVWDEDYRHAWVQGAVEFVTNGPWDGLYADNDMITLSYYSDALLAGTSNHAETDSRIRDGIDALIKEAGPALNARGKAFIPNIGDGRQRPQTYNEHAKYGGGMEEMFMSWDHKGAPTVWDWGQTGWATEIAETQVPMHALRITQAREDDMRTRLYGYSSFLLAAKPGDGWTSNAVGAVVPIIPSESRIPLGNPLGNASNEGKYWTRTFEGGWVAVNPTQEWVSIDAPAGARTWYGEAAASTISLQPMSGVVLATS